MPTEYIRRMRGLCLVCGHRTLYVHTLPDPTWGERYLIACFHCSREGLKGNGYLDALAAELSTTRQTLLRGPELFPALRLETQGEGQRTSETAGDSPEHVSPRLPSQVEIQRLTGELWGRGFGPAEARRYMRSHRMVSKAVAQQVCIGYGQLAVPGLWERSPTSFVFPCWSRPPTLLGAELLGVKLRYWPNTKDGHDRLNWPEHEAAVFPWIPPPESPWSGPILICEGEWDCLAARSQGVEAYTSTAGQHWPEAWDALLPVGRDVVVCYDAGESESRSGRLLAERLEGRAWEWPAGTREGYDICDLIRDGGDFGSD